MRWLVVGAAALAPFFLGVACFVDKKSDSIACKVSSDCTENNHTCQDGYCIQQSKSDCPGHCASCTTTVTPNICVVSSTGGDSFDCPSGFQCVINCGTEATCGTITCHDKSQCVISCAGDNSCGDIHCADACACDVTCTGGGCKGIDCPHDGSAYCTPDHTNGPACTSASGGRCNNC